MPFLPPPPHRPWKPARKVFEGRVQSKFYWSKAWRKFRAVYIQQHPLCVHCQAQDKVTAAQEIDHIKPINPVNPWDFKEGKYGHPFERDNLQALCKSCHSRKTACSR